MKWPEKIAWIAGFIIVGFIVAALCGCEPQQQPMENGSWGRDGGSR